MTKDQARILLMQTASMGDYTKTIRLDKDLVEACRLGSEALKEVIQAESIFPEVLR